MPKQTWTIGSSSSCDVVIDHATISARHCQLTADGANLHIEDLGSTNGTFVNGERLDGSQAIELSDRITLGHTLVMPWPKELAATADQGDSQHSSLPRRVITVGRADDNAVTIPESYISTRHARLIIEGESMQLEDLGSTNGTSVGTVQNKIHRAEVEIGDLVYFGSTQLTVADLIQRADSPDSISQPTLQPANQESTVRPLALAACGLFGALVGLLVWSLWPAREPAPDRASEPVAIATSDEVAADVKAHLRTAAMAADDSTRQPASDDPIAVPDEMSAVERLTMSLFVIVCSDAQGKTPFRIGTGFAIDPQRVATSAAVVDAMENLRENGFPKVTVYSPATLRTLRVNQARVHPEYAVAAELARAAQQSHDEFVDRLEKQPPGKDSFDQVKQQLLEARMAALAAIERKTAFDVGVIEVNEPLPSWVSSAGNATTLRPKLKLDVVGYAFDIEDPYFDPNVPQMLSTMPSRMSQLAPSPGGAPPRIVATGDDQHVELAFVGCPVLNAQGEVVGIYSRPTPPEALGDEAIASMIYEGALFARIAEM